MLCDLSRDVVLVTFERLESGHQHPAHPRHPRQSGARAWRQDI